MDQLNLYMQANTLYNTFTIFNRENKTTTAVTLLDCDNMALHQRNGGQLLMVIDSNVDLKTQLAHQLIHQFMPVTGQSETTTHIPATGDRAATTTSQISASSGQLLMANPLVAGNNQALSYAQHISASLTSASVSYTLQL